jgi:uncharacterized membrane protein
MLTRYYTISTVLGSIMIKNIVSVIVIAMSFKTAIKIIIGNIISIFSVPYSLHAKISNGKKTNLISMELCTKTSFKSELFSCGSLFQPYRRFWI